MWDVTVISHVPQRMPGLAAKRCPNQKIVITREARDPLFATSD